MNVEADCHPGTLQKHITRDKVHTGVVTALSTPPGLGRVAVIGQCMWRCVSQALQSGDLSLPRNMAPGHSSSGRANDSEQCRPGEPHLGRPWAPSMGAQLWPVCGLSPGVGSSQGSGAQEHRAGEGREDSGSYYPPIALPTGCLLLFINIGAVMAKLAGLPKKPHLILCKCSLV